MTYHDHLSAKTRSFRKGVLTFSAVLILSIAFNLKITKISALGIDELDPNLVFTANFIGLLYLFFSYLLYYFQDLMHQLGSDKASSIRESSSTRLSRFDAYISNHFSNTTKDFHITLKDETRVKHYERLKRIMMKKDTSNDQLAESLSSFFDKLYKESYNNITNPIVENDFTKQINDLIMERENYLTSTERNFKKMGQLIVMDKMVLLWDFWLPIASSVLAIILYLITINSS